MLPARSEGSGPRLECSLHASRIISRFFDERIARWFAQLQSSGSLPRLLLRRDFQVQNQSRDADRQNQETPRYNLEAAELELVHFRQIGENFAHSIGPSPSRTSKCVVRI